jgi:hypothetical protein
LDDNYQTYLNRVARMTLPEAYSSQVQHIQESLKFQSNQGMQRQAVPFPGYTIITPPSVEDAQNSTFYAKLQIFQQELLGLPHIGNLIVPVPPESFHLTVADLIWDNAYRDACEKNPEYDEELRSCFSEIFQQYQKSMTSQSSPIRWYSLGLMVMPRAVAVCFAPQDESSYERIINLRRAIYQNSRLMALGIEQQYHLTAHVTLGYFGEIYSSLNRTNLAKVFSDLNQQWLSNSAEFVIKRVELRKFDDMTRYYRQPDWGSLDFV